MSEPQRLAITTLYRSIPAVSLPYAWEGDNSSALVQRPVHTHAYIKKSGLHRHKTIFAPTTVITPGHDLPPINCIEDWARLLQTHTHEAFATLANLQRNHTCPPVIDSSSAALVSPDIVQHYAHGNCQCTTEVQNYLSARFRLLRLNPSVSLLQQQEMD
jgi:hypothetical protein